MLYVFIEPSCDFWTLCCCFYYLCSSIIFVLTCVLSRCLRVASSPLQSSLHLIHLTSLRQRYHPQPRQLELSLVVPLKILHQILYFIEPSSESFSSKNASTFVHTDLCSWQGRFFTFRLPPVTSPPNFPTPSILSFSVHFILLVWCTSWNYE